MKTKSDCKQQREMEAFEAEYHLPPMKMGGPDEIALARDIRHRCLRELLTQIIDALKSVSPEVAKEVYGYLDWLRRVGDAEYWIKTMRPHVGRTIEYVLSIPAENAAEEERRQREQEAQRVEHEKRKQEAAAEAKMRAAAKAAERAEARAAAKKRKEQREQFEQQQNLPRLNVPFNSKCQERYGHQCRYDVLSVLDEAALAALPPAVRSVTNPCIWIGASTKPNPVEYVLRQVERQNSSAARPNPQQSPHSLWAAAYLFNPLPIEANQ